MPRVWGVVLAAGQATRFGGDKLGAVVDGRTVLARVLATLATARDREVMHGAVVVHRATDPAAALLARAMGWDTVANPAPERGLSVSLRLGLEWLGRLPTPGPEWALVVPGDQPLLRVSVISALVAATTGDADAVSPRYRGAPDAPGHPVLIQRRLWTRVAELHGDQGFLGVLRRPDTRAVTIEVEGENPDVDWPGDLERVRILLRGSSDG